MKTIIFLNREIFEEDRTIGHININGEAFCWTLEDTVRPVGTKIPGKTAIPEGLYKLTVNMSQRFKREMIQILNVPNFEGIRIHGGNKPEDTEGCPLVAFNYAKDKKGRSMIFESAEKLLTAYIKKEIYKEDNVWIKITNMI